MHMCAVNSNVVHNMQNNALSVLDLDGFKVV